MKKLLSTLLFFACLSAYGQRHQPYPIVLIHGFNGTAENWSPLAYYLNTHLGLSIEYNTIDICLNADGNTSNSNKYQDVYTYPASLGKKDVYIVNFNVCPGSLYSNQSGTVKQGYALQFAITRVLNATGADKVILMGHSMGGLAAREYLQTTNNWVSIGQHHIAKLITVGTPHSGSNLGSADLNLGGLFGYNEASEAVRDLRYDYKSGGLGTYLYGGLESFAIIRRGIGSYFHNIDVDSNGYEGDFVTGLNRKSISTNLAFANIIGTGVMGLFGDSDGVVLSNSQDITYNYNLKVDKFYQRCASSFDYNCHSKLISDGILSCVLALDEPSETSLAYQIQLDTRYTGTFTNQSNGTLQDRDKYRIYIPQKGILTFSGEFTLSASPQLEIRNANGALVKSSYNNSNRINLDMEIPSAGFYYIDIVGMSSGAWSTYFYSTTFCPLPEQLIVTAAGPTTICEGQMLKLSATSGYDTYQWLHNGQPILGEGNTLTVSKTGLYTVRANKCGFSTSAGNSITFTVKPVAAKPTVQRHDLSDSFLLTSTSTANNEWYYEGRIIPGATTPSLTPEALGSYTVGVNLDGCLSMSDPMLVDMPKPVLKLEGSNPFCEGDSAVLVAPIGYGEYVFQEGTAEYILPVNRLAVRKAANFIVITKRGKFRSKASNVIGIEVNPMPEKPTITLRNDSLVSSSSLHNQWYINGKLSVTTQSIPNLSAGTYVVRVSQLGCYRDSDPFLITALDPSHMMSEVIVYPNPNSGEFYLNLPVSILNFEISIQTLNGQNLYHQKVINTYHNPKQISIRQPAGVYLLQIKSEGYEKSIKLIVK
jgi:pimeloyl-ACP methyl ester carboxylesterase